MKKSNNNSGDISAILKVGVGVIFLKFSAKEGPISFGRSRTARGGRVQRLVGPALQTYRGQAYSVFSAAQMDEKRRNENRERRLIRVQPKESGKH
jgi:hypothetical protein